MSAPPLGTRFGRLLVVANADPIKGRARVGCLCDCGTVKEVRVYLLEKGTTRSCGCLSRELTRTRSTTHGMTHSPEWAAWHRINERCDFVPHYVNRGIAVCARWRTSFDAFYEDMGPMPADKPTIDRINNHLGYEPGNCRWATVTEQNRNKTSNVNLTFDHRTMTVAEWAREIGMSQSGLHARLDAMTIEEALTLSDQRGQRRWRRAG